jgi:hypothetical protein
MARKRYKPEEIVAKLRQVDVLVSQGQNMVDAIRQIGVSDARPQFLSGAAQAIFFFRSGPCFLANSATPSGGPRTKRGHSASMLVHWLFDYHLCGHFGGSL